MSQEAPQVQQEHLYKLASFCVALQEALQLGGVKPEQTLAAWRAAISAECVRCGIQVSGEELFALSQPPSAERATAKIGRMRLGDCARQGCSAYYYRFSFKAHPGVDWAKVLSEVENLRQQRAKPGCAPKEWTALWLRLVHSRLPLRVGVALAMVAVLLLVRQWHLGGRIPFIREPEHFRVDPAPQELQADFLGLKPPP